MTEEMFVPNGYQPSPAPISISSDQNIGTNSIIKSSRRYSTSSCSSPLTVSVQQDSRTAVEKLVIQDITNPIFLNRNSLVVFEKKKKKKEALQLQGFKMNVEEKYSFHLYF